MFKPTPGPWVVDSGEALNVRAPHGGIVAQLHHLKGRHGMGGRLPDGEAVANARLIAAAPDLYDAAENALDVLIGCCVAGDGVGDRRAMLDAQHMLRAAIRKTYDRTLVECYIRED